MFGKRWVNQRFADRVGEIEPFRVMEVLARAKELEAQGRDIVHLEVGEPDFVTAQPIIEAAKRALDNGHTSYTPAAGIPELRQAICGWYREQYGLEIPVERILVTPGASGALLLIAALLMKPGEGMLMADPGYPCNRHFLRMVEGEGQLVPVGPAQHFQLTADLAEQHWRSNTSGVMVASPSNPTGTILSRDELLELHQLCEQKGGTLVVDEIYHGLAYGTDTPSVLSVTDDAFVINSFSKYFGMTGWRLGWLVAPEQAVLEMEKLAQNLFISPSTPAQYAALAAFELDTRNILDARRDQFAERRDYLIQALRRIGFEIESTPMGAFYIYASIRKLTDKGSQQFCLEMLEEHGIAITPGADFGNNRSDEHVRFAYTTSMERLREAVQRMEQIFVGKS